MRSSKVVLLIAVLSMSTSCSQTSPDAVPASKPDRSSLSGWRETPYGSPPASYDRIDIDTHSGDLLYYEDSVSHSGKRVIVETRLSKEVRRLGIRTLATRNWRLLWMPTDRSPSNVRLLYPDVVKAADRLAGLLDRVRKADEERRPILKEFLTSLRTEGPGLVRMRADLLSMEIAEQYGLPHLFSRDYEAQLKALRRQTTR